MYHDGGHKVIVSTKSRLKVADEVWIVTSLLQREQPERPDFSINEIVERAERQNLYGSLRPGVYVHVVQHCVANRRPNPGRYRMLFETGAGRRRLFRTGDAYHPEREGGKVTPDAEGLPHGYSGLLRWYQEWCQTSARAESAQDGILALAGSGKEIWADEHADDYVRRLREGWE
jgi:hypothetical protein